MAIRDLLWACPLCHAVDALRDDDGGGARCSACGATFRRGTGAMIVVARAGAPEQAKHASEWAALLGEPTTAGAGTDAVMLRGPAILRELDAGTPSWRHGRLMGYVQHPGPPVQGTLELRHEELRFLTDNGTPRSWPLDSITAVGASSSALQVKAAGTPLLTIRLPDSSLRLWESALENLLQDRSRELGKGAIREFQPRIVTDRGDAGREAGGGPEGAGGDGGTSNEPTGSASDERAGGAQQEPAAPGAEPGIVQRIAARMASGVEGRASSVERPALSVEGPALSVEGQKSSVESGESRWGLGPEPRAPGSQLSTFDPRPSTRTPERPSAFYHFAQIVTRALTPRVIGPVTVDDPDRVPLTGPCILVVNHQSFIDPIIFQGFCRRPLYTMAKSGQFATPGLGLLMRWLYGFPVRRFQIDAQPVRYALRLLALGRAVCIYVEGERTWDARLQPARLGTVRLLLAAGVPIIPCSIQGTYDAMPRWGHGLGHTPIRIRIGRPIALPHVLRRRHRFQLQDDVARRIITAIASLLHDSDGPGRQGAAGPGSPPAAPLIPPSPGLDVT